jgi:DNA-binding CsgD family transcriptional regulator/ArsR family metal-binding transcriptional regulator
MVDAMSKDGFITGYSNFSLRMPCPVIGKRETPADRMMIAEFRLSADISELAPYINAVADKAVYYEKPPFIRFLLDKVLCTLYQDGGSAASFSDRNQALNFMKRLVAFLNDIYLRRDSIVSNYKRYRPISVLDIFRLLPRTNCRECGLASCMAFAAALSKHKTVPDRCPGFPRPISLNAVYPVSDNKGNLLSTVSIDIDSNPSGPLSKMERATVPDGPGKRVNEMARLKRTAFKIRNDSLPVPLTERELAVLRLVAAGATNVEISDALHISPHTVKSHIIHIFNKLGVFDRTQAAVWAALNNLI